MDFFDWLESVARSMEWEDRQRTSYAREVTGASRRQERLQHRDQILLEIGSEHEDAGDATDSYLMDSLPHEHGNEFNHRGPDKCEFFDQFGGRCPHNPTKRCGDCGGMGFVEHEPERVGISNRTSCKTCAGRGSVYDPTKSTPSHQHYQYAPYMENSQVVHELPDKWTVKKTHTFGDLKYEGEMMGNCIGDDSTSEDCESCGGSGSCFCDEGSAECNECYGNGSWECGECEGAGKLDCDNCDGASGTLTACAPCKGTGEINDPSTTSGKGRCGYCSGSGKRFEFTPGKVDCETCDGTGTDEDGEECYDCDGEGKRDCDSCGGEGSSTCGSCDGAGRKECDYCEGNGYSEHYDCGGTGRCQECDGSGTFGVGGGPQGYYRPYTDSESKKFNRAPGGAYSLRDPDNIPHVSFIHGANGDDPNHIHDVYGRENAAPKPKYQHQILQYMRSKLPEDDKCRGCMGSGAMPSGISCTWCLGDGKARATIGWGRGETGRYTRSDIDDILSGNVKKPETLLIARHKTNPNQATTFQDISEAKSFSVQSDRVTESRPCTSCDDQGKAQVGDWRGDCPDCGGSKKIEDTRNVSRSYTHDLFAVPSIAVGKDQLEYEPSKARWRLKDGRASKIPFDTAGAQVPWSAFNTDCPDCGGQFQSQYRGRNTRTCQTCNGRGSIEHDHREIDKLPDFARSMLPRIASKK